MALRKSTKPLGWTKMNDVLRNASEAEAERILRDEKIGPRRIEFMLRIYARYNKMRRARELSELNAAAESPHGLDYVTEIEQRLAALEAQIKRK